MPSFGAGSPPGDALHVAVGCVGAARPLSPILGCVPDEFNVLLPTQANDVHVWLSEAGAQPRDFEWGTAYDSSGLGDILRFRENGSYRIEFSRTTVQQASSNARRAAWRLRWSPGQRVRETSATVTTWGSAEPHVKLWIESLLRQTRAPDLWAEAYLEAAALYRPTDPDDNEGFEEAEVRAIERRIETAKRLLLEIGPTQGKLEDANRKLDYLVEASTRLGRFDWRNLVVGVFMDIVVNAAFNPERAAQLWDVLVGGGRALIGA